MRSKRVWRELRLARVAMALATLLVACAREAPPPELPPRAIQWERVSAEQVSDRRVISGIVTAVEDTSLAFEVGGTVDTVKVSLGDEVERGQELARLDPEPFELAVRDAEAALAEAAARRESARADFARAEELVEAEVISRQEYDRARARRGSRDSQVEAAQARLNLARRDLRRSVLRAPFDGAISVREIEPAMKVASGQVAFEMDSGETGLRVEVQMPENLIARVAQGDEVSVSFPSDGSAPLDDGGTKNWDAVISEVGTRAGTGNAFPLRADLVETPEGLRPGMTAEVHFQLARDEGGILGLEGFLIPFAAARADANDQFSVFVYDPETSTLQQRSIQPGGVRDNEIAVLEGLSEGEIIATAGVAFLSDGQEVALMDERLIRHAP